jgi:X-X-X-Leu-X-X-Gly heptad repeat protein
MSKTDRKLPLLGLESLESRNLLTLIGSAPTIAVLNGPHVHHYRSGAVNIVQPAHIQVYGTAQPGNANTLVAVSIFAEDRGGNIVNNGQPLAVVTPDALGRYHATINLPSNIRKDVNFLVAREDAISTEVSQLAINGTTFTSTSGTLTNGTGTLNASTSTLAGGTGTLGAQTGTLAGGTGTLGAQTGTLAGGTGTLGAQTGTLAGGTGTLGAQTGTFLQTGTVTLGGVGGGQTIAGLTGTTATGATAITGIGGAITTTPTSITGIGGTVSTTPTDITGISGSISNPATQITGITGSIAVSGTIAPTTGTSTRVVREVAVSTPLAVLIHQSRNIPSVAAFARAAHPAVARRHK